MNTAHISYIKELLTRPASGPHKPFMDLQQNTVFQQVRNPMLGYYGGYSLNQLAELGFKQMGGLGSFFAIDIPVFAVVYNFFKFRHLESTRHRLHQGLTTLEQHLIRKSNRAKPITTQQMQHLANEHYYYTGMDINA